MKATPSARGRARVLALAGRSDLVTSELFTSLAAKGLDAILLRGPAIGRRLYDAGVRPYNDSDLLVQEQERSKIEDVLRGLDYVPYSAPGIAQHWRRSSDGAEVDLHLSLWGVRGHPSTLWNAMAAHRASLVVDGVAISVPDLPGTALVVALHAAQHGAVVPHTLTDLERALARFAPAVWAEAVARSEDTGSLDAFRQALTMIPAGHARLAELGLPAAMTPQSVLRAAGVRVPGYLGETLTPQERLSALGRRIAPGRDEIAAFVDPRAAASTPRLVAAHAGRWARFPIRMIRLAADWRRARREAKAILTSHGRSDALEQ